MVILAVHLTEPRLDEPQKCVLLHDGHTRRLELVVLVQMDLPKAPVFSP